MTVQPVAYFEAVRSRLAQTDWPRWGATRAEAADVLHCLSETPGIANEQRYRLRSTAHAILEGSLD